LYVYNGTYETFLGGYIKQFTLLLHHKLYNIFVQATSYADGGKGGGRIEDGGGEVDWQVLEMMITLIREYYNLFTDDYNYGVNLFTDD